VTVIGQARRFGRRPFCEGGCPTREPPTESTVDSYSHESNQSRVGQPVTPVGWLLEYPSRDQAHQDEREQAEQLERH
jgi:hypothetical protein